MRKVLRVWPSGIKDFSEINIGDSVSKFWAVEMILSTNVVKLSFISSLVLLFLSSSSIYPKWVISSNNWIPKFKILGRDLSILLIANIF